MTHILPNRTQTIVLLILAVALALVWWLRVGWIEDTALGFACDEAPTPICIVRQTIIQGFHWRVFGWVAIAIGLFALVRPQAGWATASLVLSAVALLLYNTDQGAVALIMGLVALARAGRPAPAGSKAA